MQPAPLFGHGVVFDLDEALIDSRGAWQYAVEEAVISLTGRRVTARALVEQYHRRPWAHALAVLLQPGEPANRCEALCAEMYRRSALKRLLVHEGVGMALDALRGDRIEVGAISRLPHAEAIRQIESTGLERFLAVLAPTPAGEPWKPAERLAQCMTYLGLPAGRTLFVGPGQHDLAAVAAAGVAVAEASWNAPAPTGFPAIASPGAVHACVAALARRA